MYTSLKSDLVINCSKVSLIEVLLSEVWRNIYLIEVLLSEGL